jgi:hypothetical protein
VSMDTVNDRPRYLGACIGDRFGADDSVRSMLPLPSR